MEYPSRKKIISRQILVSMGFIPENVTFRSTLGAPVRKNGDAMRASRHRADKARKISNIGNIAFFRNAVSPDGLAAKCHRICE